MGDPGQPAHRTVPRWLRGWRLLASIAVAILALTVLSLATIVLLSGDIGPVLARAKRDGLPTTWKELGLHASQGDARMLEQAKALVSAIETYEGPTISIGRRIYSNGTPGTPLNDEFLRIVRARSDTIREQVRLLVAASRSPCIPQDDPGIFRWYSLRPLRALHGLAVDELLASDDPSANEAISLLRFCRSFGPDSLRNLSARLGALQRIAKAIRYHLDAFPGRRQEIADELRTAAQELDGLYPLASRAQFAATVATVEMDPVDFARFFGVALPEILSFHSTIRLCHRLGCVELLDEERAWTLDSIRCSDPRGLTPDLRIPRTMFHAPAILLRRVLMLEQDRYEWHSGYPRARLSLLATAAALDGGAWPTDPYSTSGAMVRLLRGRDGTVLAIYGVGNNGVDDGGGRDDHVIELRAPKDVAIQAALTPPPSP